MRGRSLRSFNRRVRIFLVLVAAYLLVLQALHALHQWRAHETLGQEFGIRALAVADIALADASPERLRQSLDSWQRFGTVPMPLTLSPSYLRSRGLTSVELLTPRGLRLGTSVNADYGGEEGGSAVLGEHELLRLAQGETLVDLESGFQQEFGTPVIHVHAPVFDGLPGDEFLGILEIQVDARTLATSHGELRWRIGIQLVSILAFCGLLVWFTHWMLRPVRLLERTAQARGEDISAELAEQDDTGFVIDTYKRVIDELRDKEQELRRLRELERNRANELHALNASIVDSLVSGVLILDMAGRLSSINDAAREMLRLGAGRALERPYRDVLHHLPELHGRLQACLDHGTVIERDELRLNLAGVGRRDVVLTVSPLKGPEGERSGAICLVSDVTEVRRLQEQVRLKESMAELGELSGGIADEFRNSLATMLGNARLIENQGEGAVVEHARDIREEVSSLRTVVDDFLRFANPTRLVLETLDLGEVVSELAPDVASRGGDKNVRLEITSRLPEVTGDETLLRRVFTNLLRNAADAVEQGGLVRVSAERGERDVTIHVDDDGPGIPEADRERIFIPFVTTKDRGTGLGLALCRKVVVHHGGRIAVTDSPLGGARFSVTLPSRSEPERPTEKETEAASGR